MRGNRWLLKALPDLNGCGCRHTNAVLFRSPSAFFLSFFFFVRAAQTSYWCSAAVTFSLLSTPDTLRQLIPPACPREGRKRWRWLMWCWRVLMVFPKCWITSVYTAGTGSLFLVCIFSSLALCRFFFLFFFCLWRTAVVSLAHIPLLPTRLLSISPRPPPCRPPPPPPMATFSGRLALHGHVSTTNAPLTRGRGGGGGWLCGLFYLISVSTRASVWCKRVGVSLSPSLRPLLPVILPGLSLGCFATLSSSTCDTLRRPLNSASPNRLIIPHWNC